MRAVKLNITVRASAQQKYDESEAQEQLEAIETLKNPPRDSPLSESLPDKTRGGLEWIEM